jgi:hypothetical protein
VVKSYVDGEGAGPPGCKQDGERGMIRTEGRKNVPQGLKSVWEPVDCKNGFRKEG